MVGSTWHSPAHTCGSIRAFSDGSNAALRFAGKPPLGRPLLASRRPPAPWRLQAAANSSGGPGNDRPGKGHGSNTNRVPHADAAAPSSAAAAHEADKEVQGWALKDYVTGRSLVVGSSVATALLLTIFRKEIAPAAKWLVTQVNNLTDKSTIGEANIESFATLAAVALTLYWSFSEFRISSERLKSAEALEAGMEQRLQEVLGRLEAAEGRLGSAERELGSTRGQLESAQAEVGRLQRQLEELRLQQQGQGQGQGEGQGSVIQGQHAQRGRNGAAKQGLNGTSTREVAGR